MRRTIIPITAGQIKAARALLGWSQEVLAEGTGLAVNTIRNIEMGFMSPRHETNSLIRQLLENAGLEFTDGEGVRRRNDEIKIAQGVDSRETFFDDLLRTAKTKGGDIAIIVKSYDVFLDACGVSATRDLDRLDDLIRYATVTCLLAEAPKPDIVLPAFQFRLIAKQNISPLPCFIYDNSCTMVVLDGGINVRLVTFKLNSVAQTCRCHFLVLWEMAQAFFVPERQPRSLRRRVRA